MGPYGGQIKQNPLFVWQEIKAVEKYKNPLKKKDVNIQLKRTMENR